jgi:hypothetical protein
MDLERSDSGRTEVLSQYFPGANEENHEKIKIVHDPQRLEPSTSKIRVGNSHVASARLLRLEFQSMDAKF